MRRWELFGLADSVSTPPPPPRSRFANSATIGAAADGRPVFFSTTDTALRSRTVTGAATEVIGLPFSRCEGRDLIAVFSVEGPDLALFGRARGSVRRRDCRVHTEGTRPTFRCQVAPTHDAMECVTGTFCFAVSIERVDLRTCPRTPR